VSLCVRPSNLVNEKDMARVGQQRHREIKVWEDLEAEHYFL